MIHVAVFQPVTGDTKCGRLNVPHKRHCDLRAETSAETERILHRVFAPAREAQIA